MRSEWRARIKQLAQLERVLTDDVGAILTFFQDSPTVRLAKRKGPQVTAHNGAGGGILRIHQWTWEG